MPKVTIHFKDDLLDDVEEYVNDSIVHEDRSQLIRTAVRSYIYEGSDEFDDAGRG